MSSSLSKRRPNRYTRRKNKRPVPVTEQDVFGPLLPDATHCPHGLDWNECRICVAAADAVEEYQRGMAVR